MRSARPALLLGNALVLAAILVTRDARWGRVGWHDEAAYVAILLGAVAAWPLLRHRRPTTLVLASAGAWSTLTGIFAYEVSPRVSGGRWMTWWHAVTSAAFLVAFLLHWARNHPRLLTLAGRAGHRASTLVPFALAWAVVVALAVATFVDARQGGFVEDDHRALSDATLLGLAGLAAAGAFALVARTRTRRHARSTDHHARHATRGAVDVSLLAAMLAATVTGVVLLYAARDLRASDVRWWVIAWHVVASALLAALALGHATLNARPLKGHAR